jgi:hypothetical protein
VFIAVALQQEMCLPQRCIATVAGDTHGTEDTAFLYCCVIGAFTEELPEQIRYNMFHWSFNYKMTAMEFSNFNYYKNQKTEPSKIWN